MPLGSVAFRYNLFSAAAAAAAVGVLTATTLLLAGDALAAVIGCALFAVSGVWWSQATVAEVYALNALLVALVLYGMTRWAHRGDARGVFLAAWAFGLGLAHHLSLGLLAPGIAVCLLLGARRAPWRLVWIAPLAALIACGIALDLTTLLRARLEPAYSFSHPATWERFVLHARGAIYAARLVSPGSGEFWQRLAASVPAIAQPLTIPAALLGALGLALVWRRARPIAALCITSVLAWMLYTAMYRIPDVDVYYLPAQMLLALGLAVTLAAARRSAATRWAPRTATAALSVCALAPLALLATGWRTHDLHRVTETRAYLQAAGDIATDGGTRPATLFLDGDTELFGLSYLHLVEGQWPGLTLIDRNGTLGPNVYGLWQTTQMVTGYDTEARQRAEAQYVATARGRVYYMPAPASLPSGYTPVQRALLFEAVADTTTRDPQLGDAWKWVTLDPAHAPAGAAPHDVRSAYGQVAMLRATWELAQGRPAAARPLLRLVDALVGDEPDVLATLARLSLAAGDTALAKAQSARSIARSAFAAPSEARHGDMLLLAGDTLGAMAAYEKARGIAGGLDALQEIRLANLYATRGDWTRAIDGYTHALQHDASNPDGWLALGTAQLRAGDAAAALGSLNRAAQLRPASAAVQDNLGLAYLATGDRAAADRAFHRGVELEPANPVAWAGLGAYLFDAQRATEAEQAWRTVARLAPQYPHAHLALGLLAQQRGDLAGAEASFRRELASSPNDLQTWSQLAALYAAQGRADAATDAYRHVAALAPPGSPAAEAARAALGAR